MLETRLVLLLCRAQLDVVIRIIDGDDSLAKEKAVGYSSGMGGHGKAVYVDVLAHHLRGTRPDRRALGRHALNLNKGFVYGIYPHGTHNEIGSLVSWCNVQNEAFPTVQQLWTSGPELHLVICRDKP